MSSDTFVRIHASCVASSFLIRATEVVGSSQLCHIPSFTRIAPATLGSKFLGQVVNSLYFAPSRNEPSRLALLKQAPLRLAVRKKAFSRLACNKSAPSPFQATAHLTSWLISDMRNGDWYIQDEHFANSPLPSLHLLNHTTINARPEGLLQSNSNFVVNLLLAILAVLTACRTASVATELLGLPIYKMSDFFSRRSARHSTNRSMISTVIAMLASSAAPMADES